jgi:hypothetical protein
MAQPIPKNPRLTKPQPKGITDFLDKEFTDEMAAGKQMFELAQNRFNNLEKKLSEEFQVHLADYDRVYDTLTTKVGEYVRLQRDQCEVTVKEVGQSACCRESSPG